MTLRAFGTRGWRPVQLLLVVASILLFYAWRNKLNNDAITRQRLYNSSILTEDEPSVPDDSLVQSSDANKGKWTDEITPEFLADLDKKTEKCVNYVDYSKKAHAPYSKGKYRYPFMRPPLKCRTFASDAVEKLIVDLKLKIKSPDLARLVENCFPNTLDTTILWHKDGSSSSSKISLYPETFVVTGDIHAEWLRDSARQLSVYQPLVKYDERLKQLIKGAIYTQEQYIMNSPYCNAFHPPPNSNVKKGNTAKDNVYPRPDWNQVFECKYEIDSLASFLTLTNEYIDNTGDLSVITNRWIKAFEKILVVLKRESQPSFDPETGDALQFFYSFKRDTNIGSETLPLDGVGNPVNFDTGLIRSAFRPSDDSTILQFFVPGNVHMLTELKRIRRYLFENDLKFNFDLSVHKEHTDAFIEGIGKGIQEHAIVEHPKWGKVYAFETDGYGSSVFMDDANIPSLLSFPDLGYLDVNDETYQRTRKMILSKSGNPYYLTGRHFQGIGGPHIGIENAWPMSLLMRIRTTDDDNEILESLKYVMSTTAGLGLMHESVKVNSMKGLSYTRPWFAWCNSEFGKTILHLAKHKPHLIFKDEFASQPYDLDALFA